MRISTVGVVGAGVMGSDIALALAFHEFRILLKDVTGEALEKSKERIAKDLKMVKMMKKEARAFTLEAVLDRIRFSTDYSGFEGADLVIESVTENLEVKAAVCKELRDVCRPDAYYATNTSCISVTRIASMLPRPENVMGLHFMNPVPLMTTVETIRGYRTSPETENLLTQFLKSMGKRSVVVNDSPGFVANRLSHLFMNEAAFLVQEGVAEPKQIDMIFKHGYGHKMGPLETADLIGLDTVVQSLDVLYRSHQDPKFRCCPLMVRMVDAGLLGRKSGKGFFTY